jgi:hypothetical protein
VEGNRTNSFRVRLPRKLEFGADWCVGLAVLIYPHTWPALGTSTEQYIHVHWRSGHSFRVVLPQSTFRNPMELRDGLKRLLGEGDQQMAKRIRTLQNTMVHLEPAAMEAADNKLKALKTLKRKGDGPPSTPFRPSAKDKEESSEQQVSTPLPDKPVNWRTLYPEEWSKLYREDLKARVAADGEETVALLAAHRKPGLEEWIQCYKKVRNSCRFDFDVERQRFRVFMSEQFVERVEISDQLAYVLGLPSGGILTPENAPAAEASFQPDMRGGISTFYLYTPGLIEPVIVGDCTAPLLRVVSIRGQPDEIVEEQFVSIQYHKLLVKELSEVFVEIRTSSGTLMPFQYGTCQLTLHFKKMPYF